MLFSKIHPKHPHLGLIIPCLASEIANKNDCLMEWLNKLILLVGGLERGFYFPIYWESSSQEGWLNHQPD
jgi:hypothetical protein